MYNIRYMQINDIDKVENIEKKIFSLPWSSKSFSDACVSKNNIYLVCTDGDEIAGYCGMWTVMGEGNITNMAVSEEYRRQGIAESLMDRMHSLGKEKDVNTFFLEVRESNVAARKLYEKKGYKEIGIRKNFYEKPVENAIVMSKFI